MRKAIIFVTPFALTFLADIQGAAASSWPTSVIQSHASASFTSGTLSMNSPQPMPGLSWSNPHDGEITSTIGSLAISDARGTGEGWHVTVRAEQVFDSTNPSLHLPYGSLRLYAPRLTSWSSAHPHGIAPAITANEWTIDLPGSSVTVLEASRHHGQGRWTYSFGDAALQASLTPQLMKTLERKNQDVALSTTLHWQMVDGP